MTEEYVLGYAKKKLPINFPIQLAGYNPLREAVGVHDDVYVKALAFKKRETLHVFLTVDVLAVDQLIYEGLQESLKMNHILPSSLHIFATHTHSSLAGICETREGILKGTQEILGETDPRLVQQVITICTDVVLQSLEKMSTFTMKIGRGNVPDVGKERHDPNNGGDDSLLTIHFHLENGKKILLYHYACHPTVLNRDNQYISADFPYGVEQNLEGYDHILFINGNCGDISTRFTRVSPTFKQIDTFGKQIALAINEAVDSSTNQEKLTTFLVKTFTIPLVAKKIDSVEVAEQKLTQTEEEIQLALQGANSGERRVLESKLEGAKTNLLLAQNLQDSMEIPLTCTYIQLNDLRIITVPSEIFSSLTRELKRKYDVEIFAYCNGFHFYITDEEAYHKNYYEALSSPFEIGQGERLIKEFENVLNY